MSATACRIITKSTICAVQGVVAAVTGIAAGQVLATDASAREAGDAALEEIIITAQFREEGLQTTPIAITAVTGETLDARSQTNIVDLGSFAPNVNLSAAASIQANALSAFIRGIGQEDPSFALEPGVGVYIDDVYYGTTFGAVFDLTDLERVEVSNVRFQ